MPLNPRTPLPAQLKCACLLPSKRPAGTLQDSRLSLGEGQGGAADVASLAFTPLVLVGASATTARQRRCLTLPPGACGREGVGARLGKGLSASHDALRGMCCEAPGIPVQLALHPVASPCDCRDCLRKSSPLVIFFEAAGKDDFSTVLCLAGPPTCLPLAFCPTLLQSLQEMTP